MPPVGHSAHAFFNKHSLLRINYRTETPSHTAYNVLVNGFLLTALSPSVCTPEQIASILLQPTKDDIAAHKEALVSGEITESEYIDYLNTTKAILEIKLILVEAIRDSDMTYNAGMEALCKVFGGWNIR